MVLNRYSRAIDRCDMELLKTVYWPDAIDDHAIFVGNPVEFAEFVTPILRDRTKATMHTLSNTTIELEGDVALTETYVRAYHHMEHNGKKDDVILGGRYLDRFARRNGEWRVAERTFVLDWDVDGAVGGEVDEVHLVRPLRGEHLAETVALGHPVLGSAREQLELAIDLRGCESRLLRGSI